MDTVSRPGAGKMRSNASSSYIKHDFLFVNETTEKAGQKIGRRREIKSHVRNHIVARERLNPKVKSSLGKTDAYNPELVINFTEADESPQNLINSRSKYGPESMADIHEDITPLISSQPSGAPRLALEPCQLSELCTEHAALPKDRLQKGVSSKIKEYHTIQKVHEADCAACGTIHVDHAAHRTRSLDKRLFNMAAKKAVRWQSSRTKPSNILGSGRVDPFSCFPSMIADPNGSLDELMDHSVSYLLPGLLADGSRTEISSVSKAWMSSALKSPLLFHALVFAGSIHLDFLRSNEIHPNAPVALSHKLAVIQQLNKVLSDPKERARDEIILAILILSSHEVMDLSESQGSPFQSPLKNMQWLNVYGNIRNVHEHLKAVMDLVTLRGGVESLELYGLAEILIGGDVVAATTSLSKPTFLPLKRSLKWVDHIITWAKSPPRLPTISLGRGFSAYQQYGITTEMINLFEAISALTFGIDHFLRGEPMGLSLTAIARTRVACQQQLLALAPSSEIHHKILEMPCVYESVRMTAFIYGVAVLYPIPRTYKIFQEILRRQQAAIEISGIELYGGELEEIFLWMLILGGIAALDKPEKAWYVGKLVSLVLKSGKYTWQKVLYVMGKFLWLDSACEPGGRRLWGMVEEMSSFLDTNIWLNPPSQISANTAIAAHNIEDSR